MTSTTRTTAAGLAAQGGILLVLGAWAGLSAGGQAAGVAYGIVLCALLAHGARRAHLTGLGPANLVTLGRALLVGGVTALVVSSFTRPVHLAVLVPLAGVALALDGVDGQVARRTGSSTRLGARFDMEVDAFLILVLSVYVAAQSGWWVVALGAFRYVFVAASWIAPWLTAELPPLFSRKVVAATQGVVLVVATAGFLPGWLDRAVLIAAAASLTWSFVRDVRWLWHADRLRREVAVHGRSPIAARRVRREHHAVA